MQKRSIEIAMSKPVLFLIALVAAIALYSWSHSEQEYKCDNPVSCDLPSLK